MNLERFLRFSQPAHLLVCETDGFSLRGAVLVRDGQQWRLGQQARVEQVDMAQALADVLDQLKAGGWAGGGPVILLSPAVMTMLLELPVNPKKPRPLAQMLELVRWEVEPLLLQHTMRWSVGHLLVGRGYMTEQQAQAVMDLQQGRPNAAGGLAMQDKFSFRRFGDLAEELGYIKRSQLNQCLTGQDWLRADDQGIECGWAPLAAVDDMPGNHRWLVSCVNAGLLQRWSALVGKHGLKLRAMYPLAGCAAALLPEDSHNAVMLEALPGQAFASRLSAGQVSVLYPYMNPGKPALDICLEIYHALRLLPSDPLWLAARDGQAAELADKLHTLLAVEVRVVDDALIDGGLTPGMAGVARHALGLAEAERCVGVREGGPLPPLWQRVEVRAAVLLAVLLVLVVGVEASLLIRRNHIEGVKHEVDKKWAVIEEASRRINAQIELVNQRKQALAQQKADQIRFEATLDFYSNAVPARVTLVKQVLDMLQGVISDEVVMIAIDEPERVVKVAPPAPPTPPLPNAPPPDNRLEVEHFRLEAWAVNETAAQTFVQRMAQAAQGLALDIRDPQVIIGKGPLNHNGFTITLRLVRLMTAETSAQQPQTVTWH
ncbi:MAG: hypothetical protein KGZ80_11355 [Methylomonas sp.]|nr:hypothetical protein [Methylomonas sp.]PPD21150.1 MAG: hypothetical protein CTY23_06585 [Methylomonas sp.]PPD27585.1 MAG: hypothetical protein CTY22_01620 [Methylomonas sp.]PPD39581.1 MAG: hypothetical protein CTY21_01615 [Methylomonas sp.]PPD55832.1 MAG: hypothetical protein CTY11_00885 [Methylomonas sp.]